MLQHARRSLVPLQDVPQVDVRKADGTREDDLEGNDDRVDGENLSAVVAVADSTGNILRDISDAFYS